MADCMLSIKGNPAVVNGHASSFDEWYVWDDLLSRSYGLVNSCCRLARVARTSPDLSDKRNSEEIDRAIEFIIRTDPLGIYEKISFESNIELNN